MSALGQKQTCAAQEGMSALAPRAFEIADIAFPMEAHASSRAMSAFMVAIRGEADIPSCAAHVCF